MAEDLYFQSDLYRQCGCYQFENMKRDKVTRMCKSICPPRIVQLYFPVCTKTTSKTYKKSEFDVTNLFDVSLISCQSDIKLTNIGIKK